MAVVSLSVQNGIAIVTVDNPPVNALGQTLRQGLWDAVGTLDADPSVQAVVLICAGRTFIAGADVTEFGKPPVPPHLPDLVDRIESAAKPWIAAIHGSALGGGFEVAMGCRFRVALAGAAVGLPEVGLGIVPGASGTVRTPRLAGIAAAVDLVTTGRPVKADAAQAMGLVDAVVTGDLRDGAVAFARAALTAPLPLPTSARPVMPPDAAYWDAARAKVAARAGGAVAPLRALDCLRHAAEQPFAAAMAFERATFLDLRGSDQAAALRHVFFAERAAPRPAHLAGVVAPPLRDAVLIGPAAALADALHGAGLAVHVTDDRTDPALTRADLVIAGADDADLISMLDRVCRPDAVLITTAPGDLWRGGIDMIHPGRWISLYLGAPIPKLAEITPLPATTPQTLAAGFAVARMLGRIAVQTGGQGDQIGPRLHRRLRDAAAALVAQGTPAAQITAALRGHGFTVDLVATAARDATAADGPDDPACADTLMAALAQEGQAMLADGTAAKASDIDLVMVLGYGFPRWRGGPMFAAPDRN